MYKHHDNVFYPGLLVVILYTMVNVCVWAHVESELEAVRLSGAVQVDGAEVEAYAQLDNAAGEIRDNTDDSWSKTELQNDMIS